MCGFSGAALSDIEFAVGEAIANAVEHGHVPDSTFSLRCTFGDDAILTIEVEDRGPGFTAWRRFRDDVQRRQQELESEAAAGTRLRGFGTLLIYKLMDDVEYEDHGRRVRMRKRVPVEKTETRKITTGEA
jgi:anti-sigma regulatory factor (Ser/Thr protein kinase)